MKTAEELIIKIDSLEKENIFRHKKCISELAEYFIDVLPSASNTSLILKAEVMLHRLVIDFDEETCPLTMKNEILRPTLGLASALVTDISSGNRLSGEHFADISALGDSLQSLYKAILIAEIGP